MLVQRGTTTPTAINAGREKAISHSATAIRCKQTGFDVDQSKTQVFVSKTHRGLHNLKSAPKLLPGEIQKEKNLFVLIDIHFKLSNL
jgi:hypothetical protein